jgi:hypothetical protein
MGFAVRILPIALVAFLAEAGGHALAVGPRLL